MLGMSLYFISFFLLLCYLSSTEIYYFLGPFLSCSFFIPHFEDNRNNRKLFDAIVLGSKFTMKRKEEITSVHYFVRATSNNFNSTTNETYYTQSVAGVKEIIPGMKADPKTYITTVGMYNSSDELLAIAKLSKPILKSRAREALIKVKLDF